MKQYQKRVWLSDQEFKARYSKPDWRGKRKAVLKRDGYRCTVCGKGGKLDVHHTPEAYADFGREKLEDLVTLCKRHHPKGQYSRSELRRDRQAVRELRLIYLLAYAILRGLRHLSVFTFILLKAIILIVIRRITSSRRVKSPPPSSPEL